MNAQHRHVDTAVSDKVEHAAEEASSAFEFIGRAGWIAKGLVYALIGVLFVRIAFDTRQSDEANQVGAVEQIASTTAGTLLVVVLAVGLALYLVWRVFTVVLPGDWTGRALLDRIGYAVSAAIYASLLAAIVGILRQRNTAADKREDGLIEGLVKDVLAMTVGRTLVILAGIVVIIIGVVFAHKGWSRSFRDDISGDSGLENTLINRLGTIGWIARGSSMALIGVFLIRAAWQFDPDEAAGLDDSIRQLSTTPLGAVLAAIVGVGFIAYGVFAAVSARHQDLQGPTNQ